jgi:hypothetical protein
VHFVGLEMDENLPNKFPTIHFDPKLPQNNKFSAGVMFWVLMNTLSGRKSLTGEIEEEILEIFLTLIVTKIKNRILRSSAYFLAWLSFDIDMVIVYSFNWGFGGR